MIAPLQSKRIRVEIGQARDHVLDRPWVVRSRHPRRRCLADVARKSAHRHHAPRRALSFASRRVFFESDSTSACATSEWAAALPSAAGPLAIDTNVVVRYLVADDPEQFGRATALIERADLYSSARPSSWRSRGSFARSIASIHSRSCAACATLPRCRRSLSKTGRFSPRRSTGPSRAWTSPTRFTLRAPANAKPSRASTANSQRRRRDWARWR